MLKRKDKIYIDPMKPKYGLDYNQNNISKDSKSDQSTNLYPSNDVAINPAEPTLKNKQLLVRKAREEVVSDTLKKQGKEEKKLDDLLDRSGQVLLKIRNIIPIFRDELIIDSNKITFIYRPFFFTERIHSVTVKDITDIYIETVPFLATISVVDSGFVDEHSKNNQINNIVKVRWIWKKDAEHARRVITGLMASSKEEIDLKSIRDEDLGEKLEEVGRVRETDTSVSKA